MHSSKSSAEYRKNVDDDDDVNGVRLRLWPAATNRPIVHPPR
jgi:hypothetical protein